MTPTPVTPAVVEPGVVLDCDEAADLARLLDLVEDWLLHADDDARADLAAYSGATRLPIGFVAFVDGEPCGLAVLKAEPLPALPHLTPWASAGLVAPDCRRRGIGARLLAALEQQLQENRRNAQRARRGAVKG